MINNCKDCGDPFETDQPWKTLCSKCWLKQKHPKLYEKKYLMKKITCKICGLEFWDEAWKELCYPCWLFEQQQSKRNDLEEREQFK